MRLQKFPYRPVVSYLLFEWMANLYYMFKFSINKTMEGDKAGSSMTTKENSGEKMNKDREVSSNNF